MADDVARAMTVAEVADRLGFSEQTVRSWLEDGRLRGMRFPKGWRIERADFEAFLQAARNTGGDAHAPGGLWDDEADAPAIAPDR